MADALIQTLTDLVTGYYAERKNGPLYLSKLGQLLKDQRQPLVEAYGTLAGAIKAAGLELVARPGAAGVMAVTTADAKARVEDQFALETGPNAGSSFSSLPIPLQIAFCLKTAPDERVAVTRTYPVRYERVAAGSSPSPGHIVIEDRYRSPGLLLQNASPAELERLWSQYVAWANEAGVDPVALQTVSAPNNALERFMAAQEPDVAKRLVMPGDIIALLIRHP